MTITVQMLQTRKGIAGADLLVGQTYSLENNLAIDLVGKRFATDVYNVISLGKNADADNGLVATPEQVTALAAAGMPVSAGTLLRSSATSVVYGQSDGLGGYTGLGGAGGNIAESQTLTAVGVGAAIPTLGALRLSLTFGAPTGTVTAVTAQLENSANSAPLGVVYYPTGSPRWLDIPGGITNVQIRTTSWSGTGSIPLTVAG